MLGLMLLARIKNIDALQYEKHGKLLLEIGRLNEEISEIKARIKQTPKKIQFKQLPEDEKFKQFKGPVHQFMNALRMIAYKAETALANLLNPEWKYPEQSRTLLKEIFKAKAGIIPDTVNKTLLIRLHPLYNSRQDESAKIIARHFNETETKFPGTDLVMIFDLVSP